MDSGNIESQQNLVNTFISFLKISLISLFGFLKWWKKGHVWTKREKQWRPNRAGEPDLNWNAIFDPQNPFTQSLRARLCKCNFRGNWKLPHQQNPWVSNTLEKCFRGTQKIMFGAKSFSLMNWCWCCLVRLQIPYGKLEFIVWCGNFLQKKNKTTMVLSFVIYFLFTHLFILLCIKSWIIRNLGQNKWACGSMKVCELMGMFTLLWACSHFCLCMLLNTSCRHNFKPSFHVMAIFK